MPDTLSLYEQALDAVCQAFSQASTTGVRMQPIEVEMWKKAVNDVGPEKALSFIYFWMGGEGGRGAPRISDLHKYANPAYLNEQMAFDRLVELVATCGPWVTPPHQDCKMNAVIAALGGWVVCCETMPSEHEKFKFNEFKERFSRAWAQAQALSVQGRIGDVPRSIGLLEAAQNEGRLSGCSVGAIAVEAPSSAALLRLK